MVLDFGFDLYKKTFKKVLPLMLAIIPMQSHLKCTTYSRSKLSILRLSFSMLSQEIA